MLPILFHLPFVGLPIYSYGFMMVIGFLCAIELAKFLARRCKIDPELFVNAGLIALVTGVVGARLSHVLENLPQYTDSTRSVWANLWDAVNIRSGGLTYYGGFLLAFPTLVLYAIVKKIPVRLGMDIIAPCVMIGLAFGRIGCFLNGCCYGAACDLPWAVQFPYDSIAYQDEYLNNRLPPNHPDRRLIDETSHLLSAKTVKNVESLRKIAEDEHTQKLHPAQLYSTFTAFLLAALCLAYFTLPHVEGRVFALMLILEGLTRYLLELLRVEPPVAHIGSHALSLSMILGAALFLLGLVLWIAFGVQSSTSQRQPQLATT